MKYTVALKIDNARLKKRLQAVLRGFSELPDKGIDWQFEWMDSLQDFDRTGTDCLLLDGFSKDPAFESDPLSETSPLVILIGEKHDEDSSSSQFADCLGTQHLDTYTLEQALRFNIEKSKLEIELNYLRNHDSATGLANQSLFFERLADTIELSRQTGHPGAILLISIDSSGEVLRRLNYTSENLLSQALVNRLSATLPGRNLIAKAKQDNVILVLVPEADAAETERIAQTVLQGMRRSFEAEEQKFTLTTSIGSSNYPRDGTETEVLIRASRAALDFATAAGGDQHCAFDSIIAQESRRHTELAQALAEALTRRELEVRYQPQMALETSRITGAEALLRWHRASLGEISPEVFIPMIESSNDILHIGEWVLREAVRTAENWVSSYQSSVRLAVNVSGHQFRGKKILRDVEDLLSNSSFPADQLELELTERVFVENIQAHRDIFTELKKMGVRIALDDFGVGYSSLSYLKNFSIDTLKIDRSFVASLPDSRDDAAIVRAIISMGRNLDMRIIAEGVETEAQLEFLHEHACDEVQGHFFMKDLSAEKFAHLIEERTDKE